MPTVTPPSLTPTPTPAPQRNDRSTFSARFDAFITWFILFVTEIAALATNVYNNAVDAFNSATSASTSATAASTSATNASASATAAGSVAGASAWVSGFSYAQNQCAISQISFLTYRRTVAGSGTVDPYNAPGTWVSVVNVSVPYLKIKDQKTTGTDGGTSVASDITQTRTLNTIDQNSIGGASLSANVITLPAGTYQVRARAVADYAGKSKAFLYNASDATYTLVGSSTHTGNGAAGVFGPSDSIISGQFSIAASKNFTIRHWTENATATTGLGYSSSVTGQPEVYTEIEIWKVA